MLGLSCNMWDLVLSLGIKLRSPALGAWSLSCWTTREVPSGLFSCNMWGLLVAACKIFSCGLSDLVPQPGIEPGPPALGTWSLSHWTTMDTPNLLIITINVQLWDLVRGCQSMKPLGNKKWQDTGLSLSALSARRLPYFGSLTFCGHAWPCVCKNPHSFFVWLMLPESQTVNCFHQLKVERWMLKQITSPGVMHETSARAWCTGKTQRDRVEREVWGGIGMGNTCKSMADSCQCMTKSTTIL